MNFCETNLDKMQFLFITFEIVQICRHFGLPIAPVFPWFRMSCDVDQGTRDFRLDSSRLFYLCKFSLVVQTKCWKGAFCMDYEAKFRGKTSLMSHVPESKSQL